MNQFILGKAGLGSLTTLGHPIFLRHVTKYRPGWIAGAMGFAKKIAYGRRIDRVNVMRPVDGIPFIAQMAANEPQSAADAARKIIEVNEGKVDAIEWNLSCPKDLSRGKQFDYGAALLGARFAAVLPKVMEAMTEAVSVPIFAKVRAGFSREEPGPRFKDFIPSLISAGAQAIHVHGRFGSDTYQQPAEWDLIAEAVEIVDGKVPVIGNGNIGHYSDVRKMMEQTGCQAVSLGRIALVMPWVFEAIKTNQEVNYTPEERWKFLKGLSDDILEDHAGNLRRAFRLIREHAGWFISWHPSEFTIRRRWASMDYTDRRALDALTQEARELVLSGPQELTQLDFGRYSLQRDETPLGSSASKKIHPQPSLGGLPLAKSPSQSFLGGPPLVRLSSPRKHAQGQPRPNEVLDSEQVARLQEKGYVSLYQALKDRGLVFPGKQARRLVKEGKVRVNGEVVIPDRDSILFVSPDAFLEVDEPCLYVSRGGLKLQEAFRYFGTDRLKNGKSDAIAMDIGAAEGGFTQVLLAQGFSKVYALDKSKTALHDTLLADRRVVSLGGMDVRKINPTSVPEAVDLIVVDVYSMSLLEFIELLPPFLKPGGHILVLVKPFNEVLVPRCVKQFMKKYPPGTSAQDLEQMSFTPSEIESLTRKIKEKMDVRRKQRVKPMPSLTREFGMPNEDPHAFFLRIFDSVLKAAAILGFSCIDQRSSDVKVLSEERFFLLRPRSMHTIPD